MRDRSAAAVFAAHEADADTSAALALAAFNGAVIGMTGSVVALILGDPLFAAVSVFGATVCGVVWSRQLIE